MRYEINYFEDGKYDGTNYSENLEEAKKEANFMTLQASKRNQNRVINIELNGLVLNVYKAKEN